MNSMHDLADLLATRSQTMQLQIGTVVVVNASSSTLDIRIGAADEDPDVLEEVPRLKSYASPAVGDVVLLLSEDEEQVVIGELA